MREGVSMWIIASVLLFAPVIGFITHIVDTHLPLRDEEAYQLWVFKSDIADVKATHKTSNFTDYI